MLLKSSRRFPIESQNACQFVNHQRHFNYWWLVCAITLLQVSFNRRHGGKSKRLLLYYMEESVLLGTKRLVDSIRHFIREPSGVFSVCHLCECRIVQ